MKVNREYEIITKKGNVFKIRTYKLDGLYHADIYRLGLRGHYIYERSCYYHKNKDELFSSCQGWEKYYRENF